MEMRFERMEATIARLATAMEGVIDAMVDVQPLVLTKAQLRRAVRAAMQEDETEQPTTPPKKKAKKTGTASVVAMETDLPSPSTLTLSMLVDTSSNGTPSPPPPPPPSARVNAKAKRVPAVVASVPQQVPLLASRTPPNVVAPPQLQQHQHQQPYHQQQQTQQTHLVAPTPANRCISNPTSDRLYLWGNAWHHLPEDYEFPKESLEVMWRQWCCGVADKGFRPLREIQASDIVTTNNRKRLSDLKFLMKYIEQQLQDRGVWKDVPSEIEADQMLRAVRDALPFTPSTSKNGQKRELGGLKWHSAVSLLRNINKKARAE